MKEVPDAAAPKRLDPQTFRLDRGGAAALNEFDTHALEEGLRLKDEGGADEVVAVLMGPGRAADSLRKALAMGADRSVLIADDALAGSDLVATTRVLAKALANEPEATIRSEPAIAERRPMRSPSGPRSTEPAAMPMRPAASTGPSAARVMPHRVSSSGATNATP